MLSPSSPKAVVSILKITKILNIRDIKTVNVFKIRKIALMKIKTIKKPNIRIKEIKIEINRINVDNEKIPLKKLGYWITYGDQLTKEKALSRLKDVSRGMIFVLTIYAAFTIRAKVVNAVTPPSGTGGDIPPNGSTPPSSGDVPSGTPITPPSGDVPPGTPVTPPSGDVPPGAPVPPPGGNVPPGTPVPPGGGSVPPGAPVPPPGGNAPGGTPLPRPWWTPYYPPKRPLTRIERVKMALSRKMGTSGEYAFGACVALFIIYTFIKPKKP